MMPNPREYFKGIIVPDEPPGDWPFKDWVSPTDWEQAQLTEKAWIGFWFFDASVEALRDKLPFTQIVVGFTRSGAASAARVALRANAVYICVDWNLHKKCFLLAAGSKSFSRLLLSDLSEDILQLEYLKILNQCCVVDLADYTRVAGLLTHFVIEHELSHARSGHFRFIKEVFRTPAAARAIELVADNSAFLLTYPALMFPVIRRRKSLKDLRRLARLFGYSLTLNFLSKNARLELPGKNYPTFEERLIVIFGNCLVPCGKRRGSWAQVALNQTKAMCIVGMRDAIIDIRANNAFRLSALFDNVGDDLKHQRVNCVTCSIFARNFARRTSLLYDDILTHAKDFEQFSQTRFGGFDKKEFRKDKFEPSPCGYCSVERKFHQTLSSFRDRVAIAVKKCQQKN
ncbi:hypothetical protein [Caballeronia grimmiae]|uniref:hypothetical protein n=1 Tax=Caballeronia grimmiae TaxID=1071679 RepID=UPI0038BC45C4